MEILVEKCEPKKQNIRTRIQKKLNSVREDRFNYLTLKPKISGKGTGTERKIPLKSVRNKHSGRQSARKERKFINFNNKRFSRFSTKNK